MNTFVFALITNYNQRRGAEPAQLAFRISLLTLISFFLVTRLAPYEVNRKSLQALPASQPLSNIEKKAKTKFVRFSLHDKSFKIGD